MKTFSASIVMLLAFALAPQSSFAQQAAGAGPSKQEMAAKLEKISAALQLTPQQKKQILPILKQEIPQVEAVKNNTSLPPMQKAMQLKQISTATDAKITPILNPEQQQKWQIMREQERQQMIQKLESR
ncbi:MAG: hypothetical protein JO270_06445 [Acidobacteriaceae bacterium]|nr:hypothetical protein [Acidobacteriaceae bacterium]